MAETCLRKAALKLLAILAGRKISQISPDSDIQFGRIHFQSLDFPTVPGMRESDQGEAGWYLMWRLPRHSGVCVSVM
jgi:hypothetical protein